MRGFKDPYAEYLAEEYIKAGLPPPEYLFESAPKPPSSGLQLAGALAPAVGTVGGAYLLKKLLAEKTAEAVAPKVLAGVTPSSIVTPAAIDASTGAAIAPVSGIPIGTAGATPVLPGAVGTTSAAPSAFSLGGVGSAGNAFLPAAGAIGAYDLFKNKRKGARGIGQGAASGAALGSYFGLPGAGIGAGVGALAAILNGAFDSNKYLTEYNRAQALRDKGVNWDLTTNKPSHGKKLSELIRKDLAPDFVGLDPQKAWANNKFASSRNESDLKPEDIWGYSAFGERYGNDWLKGFSEQKRRDIAQKALDLGLVNEHHGTIDIGSSPQLDSFVSSYKLPQQPKRR